jgi:4-hydroxybenzoate polyprenyltransferase
VNLQQIYYFIRLCRPVNLVIIAVTMYLLRMNVVGLYIFHSAEDHSGVQFVISDFHFFLLVFSTLLIAGAGYIINDYFDIRIDRINKPEKVIVGKYIKKRVAMLTHTILNFIAVCIGVYLSLKYHNWLPVIFHLSTTSLLWLYSLFLKRKFLTGNIVTALLSAMVPLLVGWFEIPMAFKEYPYLVNLKDPFHIFHYSMNLVLAYTVMAFLTTLAREIIKDIADMKGDQVQKCSTMPIVIGVYKTKLIVLFVLLISILAVVLGQLYFFPGKFELFYVSAFVTLPLVLAGLITYQAKERSRFLVASNFIKLSMFAALLFTFMIAYA